MEGGERLLGWQFQKQQYKSGCGVVSTGADRDEWVTISKVPVPMSVGMAMAAEVICVCVLTEILDLVFKKSLSVQNFNLCTDTLLKNR